MLSACRAPGISPHLFSQQVTAAETMTVVATMTAIRENVRSSLIGYAFENAET